MQIYCIFIITIVILLISTAPNTKTAPQKSFTNMEQNSSCPKKLPVLILSSAFWDAALLFPCRYEGLLIVRILIIISSKISTVGSILQETCAKQINPCQKEKLPTDTENKYSFQVSLKIIKVTEISKKKKEKWLKHKY